MPNFRKRVFLASISLFSVQATLVHATDIVISTDQTSTVDLNNDGDTLTVNNGVTIDTNGGALDSGVVLNGSDQTVTNYGTINGDDHGLTDGSSNKKNNSIINHGTITGGDDGVRISISDGTNNSLANYGQISSSGGDGFSYGSSDGYGFTINNYPGGTIFSSSRDGLYISASDGAYGTVINHKGGKIWSTASDGFGLGSTKGYRNTIINYGDIWTTGDRYGAFFQMSGGYGNKLINYGSIKSSGSHAVWFSNSVGSNPEDIVDEHEEITEFVASDNELINYGTIESTASHGVLFQSSNRSETITNAGTIIAAGGSDAIHITNDMIGSTINLLPGTVLYGGIHFGSPADTLNVSNGLNLYLDYSDTLETFNTQMPFIHDVANTLLYTFDPAGFALSNDFAYSTTSAVNNIGLDAARGNTGFSGADLNGSGYAQQAARDPVQRKAEFWSKGFGGIQNYGNSGGHSDSVQRYAGAVFGGGLKPDDTSLGFLFGTSFGDLKTTSNSQKVEATSKFAGVYGGKQLGEYWLSFSTLIGHSDFETERNFTSIDGLETATAGYNGYFASAALDWTRSLSHNVQLNLGANYTGVFLDGYQESITSASLRVGNRQAHMVRLTTELNMLAFERETETGKLKANVWTGVDGAFQMGDANVDLAVNGLSTQFDSARGSFELAGSLGMGFEYLADKEDWSFDGSVEAKIGSNELVEVNTSFGLGLLF